MEKRLSDIDPEEEEEGEEEEDEEQAPKFTPTFNSNILTLEHSFGFDSKRLFNMVLIDDDTLVFASGNFLHYFSISRREVTIRETEFGCGIGFITKNNHPDYQGLLTVAENGYRPTIFVYKYPSHEVHTKLERAAKACFTCGSYNSTGELFASQAGHPDFMLTIWRWETAEIILRAKSYQNNVLFVHFSAFNPILLCSCGLSHIKFWKMANTFTGLKLQGDLGRFGKTDFSDIYAIYMLGDENVISGCEWGNMLLWEAGLIKFEICRKGRKPCHLKPIVRITMENGEVTTVGMDGYVRIWFWETVDVADPPDEDRFVEIEPIYEFKISDCEIRCIQKIKPFDNTDYGHYVQDGKGGIWYCDINVSDEPQPTRKLYSTHGGKVVAGHASPISNHFMTLGDDGKILVYDYAAKTRILEKQFIAAGTDLLWLNTKVSSNGMEIVAGFADGIFRHLYLELENTKHPKLHLVRAHKAHTAAITKFGVSRSKTMLISGSADKTIFVYSATDKRNGLVNFTPMYYVELGGIPNCYCWAKNTPATLLIGCQIGKIYEVKLPTQIDSQKTFLSYNMTDPSNIRSTTFVSVKSMIRRMLRREQIKRRKEKKRRRKLAEIEELKRINPGLQIDMNAALADSEPEEEEEPLHTPAIPNPVTWIRYTRTNTFYVSMGGYDAGYLYEYGFQANNPIASTMVYEGDDIEMRCYLRIAEYFLFGLNTGKLRINITYPANFTDLYNYRYFGMHDPLNGVVSKIFQTHDGRRIISIGHDGNVFLYRWKGPQYEQPIHPLKLVVIQNLEGVLDIVDPAHPSLEQEKINAEIKRQEDAAAAHERKVLAQIAEQQVKFDYIVRTNKELPRKLQLQHKDMLLDKRITKQIADELQAELDDVRDDLAYDLEYAQVGKTKLYEYFLRDLEYLPFRVDGIGNDIVMNSFRHQALTDEFYKLREEIEEHIRMLRAKKQIMKIDSESEPSDSMPDVPAESFFFGRNPMKIVPRFSKRMLRLLLRYRARQLYEVERIWRWDKLERHKPNPNKNHPDDDAKIAEARRNLGDYKLKMGFDYEPHLDENLTFMYQECAECRENYFKILSAFNKKVLDIRRVKKKLYEEIQEDRRRLDIIHSLLPEKNRRYMPDIPEIDFNAEYPELNLEEHYDPSCGIEISDILFLDKTVKDLMPTPPISKHTRRVDRNEVNSFLRSKILRAHELDFIPSPEEILAELEQLPKVSDPLYFESEDDQPSAWLVESRYRWLFQLIDEQDAIITKVKQQVNKFNDDLQAMNLDRFKAKFEVEFILTYMTTLNQEMYIMRDSEQIENVLQSKADIAMETRNRMQLTINATNRQIEDGRKQCEKLTEQISQKNSRFLTSIKGQKFFDFLRRIFKKKWKPPKPPKDDDETSESSSSESSSSEEEDDTKSIDSLDMATIKLDENTCPDGLEKFVYNSAFLERTERHMLEKALVDQQRLIEQRRATVAQLQKEMRFHEEIFAKENENITTFRRRRQQELNKINIAVFLQMSQMQHFLAGQDYRDISKAVLFDSRKLSALHKRVEELKEEELETRRFHRINIVHLRRLNTDIKFMRKQISNLEDDIKEEMMKKFGLVVDLDILEEEVLRRYVFGLETTAEDELRMMEKELAKKKAILRLREEDLIRVTKENTEKLNILEVLREEQNMLDQILDQQDKKFELWTRPKPLNIDLDIERLTAIDRQQKHQIECLEREICTLRLRGKPLQIDHDGKVIGAVHEILPHEDINVCPEMLETDAFNLRRVPDDFTMDRVQKIVHKCFLHHFANKMTKDTIRKYGFKVARYLGQAAFSLEGNVTPRIMDCLTENLEGLLPKKYLMLLRSEDIQSLFNEVVAVFDYVRSEVNTEDLISGIFSNAKETLKKDTLNKLQHILEYVFKELISVLPLEEFQSEDTLNAIVDVMEREGLIEPRFIIIEKLVEETVKFAKENILDSITALPIRRLAENIGKLLQQRHPVRVDPECFVSSVAISSKDKKNMPQFFDK